MPDKTLRVLIADEQLEQLLQLEKMLNGLGYFRIAPVQSFDQLLVMVQTAVKPFDVLIANKAMAVKLGVDLPRLCKCSPLVRHTLMYEARKAGGFFIEEGQGAGSGKHLERFPDAEHLHRFMAQADASNAQGQGSGKVTPLRTGARRPNITPFIGTRF